MLERLTAIPSTFFTPDGERLSFRAYVFLIFLCAAFFIPGLATLPPTDRDESSFAQASKQMIESGNYIDIRLQDKPRYKKPIGIYWLQAASVRLLDRAHLNEIWAYRIPSFAGATLAVAMTAALGSLLFGPLAGFLAAIMMTGCVILNVEARLAKTDAALLGSIMVAQYALARAYTNTRITWRIPLVFWTAIGAGILIKGPIILLVLFSTLLWLRLTEKNLKWFSSLKPLVGIPYLLLLVAPWFVAIALQTQGEFLQQSAGHDLLAKLWQGQDRGNMPPGLHLLAFPFVFFPFALFATFAVPDTWKNRHEPAVRFCLGWIIPTWIVFELSLTKLPHYVLPTYPAIAMLVAKAMTSGFPALGEKNWRWPLALMTGLWLMIGSGYALLFALLPYLADHVWNAGQIAAGALVIIVQAISLFLLFQRKIESVLVLAAGSLIFVACTLGNTLPGLQHLWVSRQVAEIAYATRPCEHVQIVSASYDEPSLIFLTGSDTDIVFAGVDAAYKMRRNHCLTGLIDDDHKPSFLDGFRDSPQKPIMVGAAEGLNIGAGKSRELTVYVLPSTAKHP